MKKDQFVVKFKKPYQFEGQEYKEIDLSGLQKLTAQDLVAAETQYAATGQASALTEMSIGYTCIVAATATKKPVEFFNGLPAPEIIKIKNIVTSFFYNWG